MIVWLAVLSLSTIVWVLINKLKMFVAMIIILSRYISHLKIMFVAIQGEFIAQLKTILICVIILLQWRQLITLFSMSINFARYSCCIVSTHAGRIWRNSINSSQPRGAHQMCHYSLESQG